MSKIQAIVFDWGGVLIESPASGLVRFCAKALGVNEENYKQAYNIFMDDFQTGKVSEKQFWKNMTSRLGISMPEVDSLWGDAFAAVYKPKAEMFSFASRMRKAGCKIVLLSNTEKPAVDFFKKQKYEMFDLTVFSCLEGTRKPQSEIYEITLERLKIPAARTLFIDDKQENIEGAKKVGLNAILFESIEQFKKNLLKFSLNIV